MLVSLVISISFVLWVHCVFKVYGKLEKEILDFHTAVEKAKTENPNFKPTMSYLRLYSLLSKYYALAPYYHLKWNVFSTWFQNLMESEQDKESYKFHFRGDLSFLKDYREPIFKYEVVCYQKRKGFGFDFKPNLYHGSIDLNLQFYKFSAYLTFNKLPKIKMMNYRLQISLSQDSVDLSDYIFWFTLTRGGNEWGDGAKGIKKLKSIKDLIFGKVVHYSTQDSWLCFKDVVFQFRGKEYVATEINLEKVTRFRSRIPYGLHKRTHYRQEIKVSNPPQFAGKGENSWDCDDDSIFSSSYSLPKEELDKHDLVTTQGRNYLKEYAINKYCESVSNNIRRRGRAANDTFKGEDKPIILNKRISREARIEELLTNPPNQVGEVESGVLQ